MITAEADSLESLDRADLTPAPPRAWWHGKALLAAVLVGTFLVAAYLLIFVMSPSAGAAGGCGGG